MGRDEELNRVSKLLGESRLVILTGPGGTGKTRLAIEAAARLTDQMPDGVWFVALAPVGDALDVPQAVLSVIGPPDSVWVGDTRTRSAPSCPRWTGWPTCWPPGSWSWSWTTAST